MKTITIPGTERYNEEKNEFVTTKSHTINIEHSLVSISKWESKWKKPFLESKKTYAEIKDYIKCMTITQNIPDEVYDCLSKENIEEIISYIEDPMTATWFNENGNQPKHHDIITSEVIYYQMINLGIPVEFQKWHINRLLTLIKVCSIKESPPQKMSRDATLRQYAALNAARRKHPGKK